MNLNCFVWSFKFCIAIHGNTCHAFSGLLTKKFINLIKHAEDGMLDLNNAAETLEVNLFVICVFY